MRFFDLCDDHFLLLTTFGLNAKQLGQSERFGFECTVIGYGQPFMAMSTFIRLFVWDGEWCGAVVSGYRLLYYKNLFQLPSVEDYTDVVPMQRPQQQQFYKQPV